MTISNPYPGIYYVEGKTLFPVQIVVTRELDIDKHIWLVALSGKLTEQQVEKILAKASQLTNKREKKLADSVLQVCVAANKKIVEKLKGENHMCQALLEIMEPEIRQWKEESMAAGRAEGMAVGRAETRSEDIAIAVNMLRDLGQSEDAIRGIIIKNFSLHSKEAEKYMAI